MTKIASARTKIYANETTAGNSNVFMEGFILIFSGIAIWIFWLSLIPFLKEYVGVLIVGSVCLQSLYLTTHLDKRILCLFSLLWAWTVFTMEEVRGMGIALQPA